MLHLSSSHDRGLAQPRVPNIQPRVSAVRPSSSSMALGDGRVSACFKTSSGWARKSIALMSPNTISDVSGQQELPSP